MELRLHVGSAGPRNETPTPPSLYFSSPFKAAMGMAREIIPPPPPPTPWLLVMLTAASAGEWATPATCDR